MLILLPLLLFPQTPAAGQPAPAEAAKPAPAAAYTLHSGDILDIRVYNFPELSQEAVILPDGRISVPLMNDVMAQGKTPGELSDFLTEGLARQVRNPKVSVVVKGFAGRNVYVGGEVGQPSQVPLVGTLSAVQAIFQSGGVRETSDTANVALIRNPAKGNPETRSINVEKILRNQEPDVPLQAGDVIYVPKSTVNVYVGGEVEKPGLQPLNKRLTLMAAVISAGGLKRSAKRNAIVLLRDDGSGKPLVSKLNVEEIMNGAADAVLQPYDVVIVPKSGIAKLNDWVDQYLRQMSPVTLSLGFSYVLGFPAQQIF
jgi:polysaccharide biosynthesis/export protein